MGRFGPVEILYNTNQLSCFVIVIIDRGNIFAFWRGWKSAIIAWELFFRDFSDWTQIAGQVCAALQGLATQSHLWIQFNC